MTRVDIEEIIRVLDITNFDNKDPDFFSILMDAIDDKEVSNLVNRWLVEFLMDEADRVVRDIKELYSEYLDSNNSEEMAQIVFKTKAFKAYLRSIEKLIKSF